MAINKVEYNGEVLIDLTEDTVTEGTLARGVTAHNAAGELITGTMAGGTFKVNSDFNPANMTVINLDKSLEEINTAFDEGYSVILVVDLTSIGEQGCTIFPLGTKGTENSSFFGQIYMDDVYFVVVSVFESGASKTLMIPLATQEQLDTRLGGLTLGVADTAPTDDNPNNITFVDEG